MKIHIRWALISLLFFCIRIPLHAQTTKQYEYAAIASKDYKPSFVSNNSSVKDDNSVELKVLNDLENSFDKKPNRKDLLLFLRKINADSKLRGTRSGSKLYLHLASSFARLKLYPLVMKCYFKTDLPTDDIYKEGNFIKKENGDSTVLSTQKLADTLTSAKGVLAINDADSLLLKTDSGLYNHNGKNIKSKQIREHDIVSPFDDGKTAVRYAMLIHIQQPVSGKPKIFVKINQVGHTFITLIKYNADSTYVARTFGFYPQKDHLLSATPIFPSTTSEFKNDSLHDWDEVIGKFISKHRFQKILELVKQYDHTKYDLNKNNCTDFGLNVAAISGIKILNTFGTWPMGRGNNPGVAGQSVVQGRVINSDTGDKNDLFIFNDLIPAN
ncbi:hypothetical protein HDF24_14370 [Mucilaginibacter sp. X4EP1]|uniref:hypothetical protein n=1 Tax=Mucilaginibacter sp. X4EP1 TaxID=2723092 RepID=UPI0021674836|nr:hypothetical protein [Mucilaginibacter sp. X4EP1]MCS3814752.1 hypothetical protein [Mucilaginibacter sp. X4EP1]